MKDVPHEERQTAQMRSMALVAKDESGRSYLDDLPKDPWDHEYLPARGATAPVTYGGDQPRDWR
jgi:hypothetical protein